MAYAKTSERREKRLLREQMRSMGLGYRDIAAEFARRYGMRPRAASTMIRPVGVGRTSPGPIGVDGLTMTAGNFCSAIMASTRRSAMTLLYL